MIHVLNDAATPPASARSRGETRAGEPGLMQRLHAALVESRTRSVARALHARDLLVNEAGIVLGGFPSTTLSSDVPLPFNR